MAECMLTTIDNPYDPFTQYEEWLAFDEYQSLLTGRPTCNSYVASMARTSPDLTPEDCQEEVERAITSIVELNLSGTFRKVYNDSQS